MTYSQLHQDAHLCEVSRLWSKVYAIEAEAGIGEARAIDRENGNKDLRRLYFSVHDKALRERLIKGYRSVRIYESYITGAKLRDAERTLRNLELTPFFVIVMTALWGAICVIAGWEFAKVPGALTGAVMISFFGNYYVSNYSRLARDSEIEEIKWKIDCLRKDQEYEAKQMPNPLFDVGHTYGFSKQEENSGDEDMSEKCEFDK